MKMDFPGATVFCGDILSKIVPGNERVSKMKLEKFRFPLIMVHNLERYFVLFLSVYQRQLRCRYLKSAVKFVT